MEYRSIPGIEKPVSRLVFGTASAAFSSGGGNNALLDYGLDAGINLIDTARNYGLAERSIGQWLRERSCRDRVVLLSKCAHPNILGRKRVTEADIRKDFAKSAALLGTDFIDIYLLHRDDPEVDVSVPIGVLNAMHKEGKIGIFGVSNWSHKRIQEANDYAARSGLQGFSVSSPHFSLARQQADPWGGGCVSITGEENEEARNWYRENQMPILAYSSLGRGLLSGKLKSTQEDNARKILDAAAMKGYGCPDNFLRLARCEELAARKNCTVAQIAMAWLYNQQLNTFAVATMSSPKRIEENIGAFSVSLTPEECRHLNLEEESL